MEELEQVKIITRLLKSRFPNLTTQETVDFAIVIILAIRGKI